MDGTTYLLLKYNTNLFLLYKQGFKGNKKYLETIEKKLNSSSKNLYQKSIKYVENHLEKMVPTILINNILNPKCAYTQLYHSI
tara:strand:+ start:1255 stop:1503 length:249 start_codon:yes stop_codon:yes gene_type:complete